MLNALGAESVSRVGRRHDTRLVKANLIKQCIMLALTCSCLCGCITYSTIDAAKGSPRKHGNGEMVPAAKPEPGYYWLVPLTVPADIVTSPFQGIWFLMVWATDWNG